MKNKIALVYPFIPHYRIAVFKLLQKSGIDIYSGQTSNMPNLNVANEKDIDGVFWQTNTWLFGYFLWQSKSSDLLRYDTVIFLGDYKYINVWVIALYFKLKGRKCYFWTHGLKKKESGLKGIVRKIFYSLSSGLLLYGERSKKLLLESGFSEEKLHVIYNSLDVNVQNNLYKKYSSSISKNNSVIYVGRILRNKRLDLLIYAIEYLYDNGVEIKANIVGGGDADYVDYLKSVCKYDLVTFHGEIYDENILAKHFLSNKVTVVPGDLGLTAMHSLAYGVPIVTHDNYLTQKPESEALVSGITGEYYRENDIISLANTIMKVCGDYEVYSVACLELIKTKYNPEHQAKLISEIIGSK